MLESLEKMLAKGVDNALLRFGLGKGYLDLGENAKAAEHFSVVSLSIRNTRQRGNCWARCSWR